MTSPKDLKNVNLNNMSPDELKDRFLDVKNSMFIILDDFTSYSYTRGTNQYKLRDKAYNDLTEMWAHLYAILDTMKSKVNQYKRVDVNKMNMSDDTIDKAKTEIILDQDKINDNKKVISSREQQYQLAIERNAHRRKMIVMLAILNTIFLLTYYFITK
jgi:hypothetical protein